MTDFKSLEVLNYPRVGLKSTPDTCYWKNFSFPIAFKEYGAIDFINFSLQEPHNIAVTCSSKVQIYSPINNSVQSTLSRFKQTAYGGVFRKDGKLLVAGSEDGFLRLFKVESNKLLRVFKGHKSATHRCDFTKDGVRVVSFSDDKSVALWDIATETKISSFSDHQDYIRAGATDPASQNIFISGSYDQTVKMYDTRTSSCVMSVDHGAPVESVLVFSFGGLFVSAGGTSMKVWDPNAGRMLTQVMQHHKTITSLCFASNHRRLMSGSLDRHVKIYDVLSYEVVHTLDYSSPILSVATGPEDKVIAVGMTDGLFSVKHQKFDLENKEPKKKKNTFYKYHWYGTDFKPSESDVIVPEKKTKEMTLYDKHLRKFESSRALDVVIKYRVQNSNPEVTVSVLMELIRRGTIKAALAGREGDSLQKLFKFVAKYIKDPKFQRVLIDVGRMLTELYGPKLSNPEIKELAEELLKSVENEILGIKHSMEIHSVFETVLLAHSLNEN